MHAQAQVRAAAAEGQVPVRAAPHVERVRLGELGLVPVPGHVPEHHLVPGPDARPAQLGVRGGGPAHEVGGAAPPDHLVGGRLDQARVGPQPVPLLRVLAEGQHPLGDRDPGGLVARHDQDREEVVQVGLAQPVAVHLGAQQLRQQVVAGLAQLVLDHLAAQVPQPLAVGAAEREPPVGVGVIPAPDHVGDLRVGVGDQPVAEVDEQVEVGRGQPHDLREHPDRDLLGHRVHEVEGPAGRHPVQHVLGQPGDEVLVDRDGPLRERARHDLAQLGVLGRVGVDDRAPGGHVLVGRLLEGHPAG